MYYFYFEQKNNIKTMITYMYCIFLGDLYTNQTGFSSSLQHILVMKVHLHGRNLTFNHFVVYFSCTCKNV